MGNAKARKARAREAREAQNREAQDREAREAQDREARVAQYITREAREATARWKAFGVCTVLGSIGAAVKNKLLCLQLLPYVIFLILGQEAGMLGMVLGIVGATVAGMVGMVLGIVGATVLGLHNWVWSWILPIASFKIMENRKPVLRDSVPIVLLLGVERVVLIVGVAVLGWQCGLALDVATIIVETRTSWRWARSWLWQYGLAEWRYCTGLRRGMMWLDVIIFLTLPLLLVLNLPFLIYWVVRVLF